MNNFELLIYQAPDGRIKIDVRLEDEAEGDPPVVGYCFDMAENAVYFI